MKNSTTGTKNFFLIQFHNWSLVDYVLWLSEQKNMATEVIDKLYIYIIHFNM